LYREVRKYTSGDEHSCYSAEKMLYCGLSAYNSMKSSKKQEEEISVPISKTNTIQGSRTLVREKVMQILVAHFISNTNVNKLFEHIFYRDFKGLDENDDATKTAVRTKKPKPSVSDIIPLLTDEEFDNIYADKGILWRPADEAFGKDLLESCQQNQQHIMAMIDTNSENWDIERIPIVDKIAIIIAVSEMLDFPYISAITSINEAVNISKKYSSENGYIFVNGILHSLKHKLEK
jgi:transcription antitermination factor NusB